MTTAPTRMPTRTRPVRPRKVSFTYPAGRRQQYFVNDQMVLSHLVAGRTNAEIARDLFISDKTVSVHVTNVLRKTGTPNRIEAASLALRLGLN